MKKNPNYKEESKPAVCVRDDRNLNQNCSKKMYQMGQNKLRLGLSSKGQIQQRVSFSHTTNKQNSD